MLCLSACRWRAAICLDGVGLVALKPDVLFGPGQQVALAMKSATATIPIVFVGVYDPEAIGLVQSLSHPGGNITGLATSVAMPGGLVGCRNPPGTGA